MTLFFIFFSELSNQNDNNVLFESTQLDNINETPTGPYLNSNNYESTTNRVKGILGVSGKACLLALIHEYICLILIQYYN